MKSDCSDLYNKIEALIIMRKGLISPKIPKLYHILNCEYYFIFEC